MSINQNLEHITQTGGDSNIEIDAVDTPISDSVMVSVSLLIAFLIYLGYKLITGFLNKSCIGCRRLKVCEQEVAKIKAVLNTEKHIQPETLKEILEEVKELRERIVK